MLNSIVADSNALVSGTVTFMTGKLIDIKPGFHSVSGTNFIASVRGVTKPYAIKSYSRWEILLYVLKT